MPVYKDNRIKKKEKWYYEIELGRDENGKRKRIRARGFKTKKEAEEEMIRVKTLIMEGRYVETKNITYRELFYQWIKNKHELSNSTKEMYLTNFKNHINPGIGNYQIKNISPFIIQNFINSLYEKQLSPSTVRRIYSIVRASLQFAVRMNLSNINNADLIEKPKEKKMGEVKVWNVDEIKTFLKNVENSSRYAIAFKLAIYTGMRQGEILGLRWKDINFEKKQLTIQQKLTRTGKLESGAKNKSSIRTISLNDYIINELKKHKDIIQSEKKMNNKQYKDYNLVVCTEFGTPCNPRNLLRVFYSQIKQTRLPKIKFHDLRHTHASLLLMAGVNVKVISERLGHSGIRITLDTYSHLLPNMQEEAIDKFDKLFEE